MCSARIHTPKVRDELKNDGGRHVLARGPITAKGASRAPGRRRRCRPPRAETSGQPPPREKPWRRRRPRRAGRSGARWRRSAGFRPRGSSGCDAAAASGRSTAVAAAASGGATTAPSTIAGRPRHRRDSVRTTTATATVVSPTAKTTRPVTGAQLSLQIPGRRVVRRVEQHRGDEERQRELGRDAERRRAGNEREQRAAEREEDRIRRADAARRRRQDHGRDEEGEKLFEFPHGASCGST